MAYYTYRPGMSIPDIVRNWQRGDKLYDEEVHTKLDPEDLWPYREYTRSREGGRNSPEEWNELYQKMVSSGWNPKNPALVLIGKNGNALVGEGNHRLAIARELKIPVSVRFEFRQDVGRRQYNPSTIMHTPICPFIETPDHRRLNPEVASSIFWALGAAAIGIGAYLYLNRGQMTLTAGSPTGPTTPDGIRGTGGGTGPTPMGGRPPSARPWLLSPVLSNPSSRIIVVGLGDAIEAKMLASQLRAATGSFPVDTVGLGTESEAQLNTYLQRRQLQPRPPNSFGQTQDVFLVVGRGPDVATVMNAVFAKIETDDAVVVIPASATVADIAGLAEVLPNLRANGVHVAGIAPTQTTGSVSWGAVTLMDLKSDTGIPAEKRI